MLIKKINQQITTGFSKIPEPIILALVCILAYGLLIPWLGFYLDDWYIVLFQKVFGATDFTDFFRGDRPLFAYIYQVFVPIFRDSILGWQIFALVTHSLAVITFWYLLRRLMPERGTLVFIASLLFAVYPGFQFHWFSVMYSQAYVLNVFYFFSFILMIGSIQKKNWLFAVGAVLCLIIGVMPAEDFFGLELVRPVVIFILLSKTFGKNWLAVKKTLFSWLPYLLVLLGFLFFRLGFSQEYSYPVSLLSELKNAPVQKLLTLIGEVFWSLVDASITTWINLIFLLKREIFTAVSIAMLTVILLGFAVIYISLKSKFTPDKEQKDNAWVIIIGLYATVVSMVPFIAGSFKITLEFPNNRFLLALTPGAALFLAGLIETLLRTDKQKIVVVSLLVGFAIGSQFMVARGFMNTWKAQQDLFWQLYWRAPSIKKNTVLITEDLPFSKYFSGSSLTAPLNIIYAPDLADHEIPYFMILSSQQKEVIQSYAPDLPLQIVLRSFEFSGNTSSMLVYKKPADACLHIVEPDEPSDAYTRSPENDFWEMAIPRSNPETLIVDSGGAVPPPKKFFGQENMDQWCYFYEKAELAGQQQEWEKVTQIYSKAQKAGFAPLADTEWRPLIKAYLNLGEYGTALEITGNIDSTNTKIIPGFCKLWAEVDRGLLEVGQAEDLLNCP